MSYKQQMNKSKGFTIIEVLIVLAIAGLILLIVFLAVPALQRSARNTQRKNDVSAMLGAISEYQDNNGGALPTQYWQSGTSVTFQTGAANEATSNAKAGFYTGLGTSGSPDSIAALTTGQTKNASTDVVNFYTNATCSGNGAIYTSSNDSYAAVYGVEQSGGTFASNCVQ